MESTPGKKKPGPLMPVDEENEVSDHTLAYSPFDVSDANDTGPLGHTVGSFVRETKSYWLGRIWVVKLAGRELFIGPHWYCSILMLVFILGVGIFHCSTVASATSDPLQLLGGLTVTSLSLISFLRCAFSDPGVLLKSPEDQMPTESTTANQRACSVCQVIQPRGCQHCHFCQVCILGHDHHCPWMGKCIGQKNLCAFYTFLTVAFSSLGYIMISALSMPTS